MNAVARMIDANANRAREALRVLEDVARFALDDPRLSAEAKCLRHELRDALAGLPSGWMTASRDTRGDVGTTITTDAEQRRRGLPDVAAAAGARLGEALRVLEEATKLAPGGRAAAIERIRYRGYDLDARLRARLGAGPQWRVCVLLTEALCARPWTDVADATLAGGADCIQLREKAIDDRELLRRTRWLLERARAVGAAIVVNDRVDIALAAGAHGVHVGQGDLDVEDIRRIAGRTLLVGVSAHDAREAAAAVAAGADYCGVGAMYTTARKPYRRPAGPEWLRAFRAAHPEMPHLAIGGITPANVAEVVESGAEGIAVCGAVCGADDPRGVVELLVARRVDEATRRRSDGGVERSDGATVTA